METSHYFPAAATCLLAAVSVVFGQTEDKPAAEKPVPEVNSVTSVTVAIIDFESRAPGNPELGSQVGDILTARLSIYDQFQLVERKKLEKLFKEHEMNLTGMVATGDAVKVGKLVGARIMIFGRAFTVDKDLYFVAKIVGTETSRVKGVIAKGNLESNLSEIIDQLVDKLVGGLYGVARRQVVAGGGFGRERLQRYAHYRREAVVVGIERFKDDYLVARRGHAEEREEKRLGTAGRNQDLIRGEVDPEAAVVFAVGLAQRGLALGAAVRDYFVRVFA